MENEYELEGYLMKYCGKGLLGGFKKRWFLYNDSNKKLEYFKCKTDRIPLDSLDLKCATFSINCQDEYLDNFENNVKNDSSTMKYTKLTQSCCTFKIISGEKFLLLKADSPQQSIYWLKKLQNIRERLTQDKNYCDYEYKTKENLDQNYDELNNEKISSTDYYLNETFNLTQKNDIEISSSTLNSYINTLPDTKNNLFLNIFNKIRKENLIKNDSLTKNNSFKCKNCKELKDQIVILNDDITAFENEIYGNKEVNKVLQNEIEKLNLEKNALEQYCQSFQKGEDKKFYNFIDKEKELINCKLKIKNQQDKLNKYIEENKVLKKTLNEVKSDKSVLNEMLLVKDKTAISLTNEIFNLENGLSSYLSAIETSNDNKINAIKFEDTECEQLKDAIQAFQSQNQFLNKEIIELNRIKKVSEAQKQKLELECYEWQAKCDQIQSKLLSLLKEINNIEENSQNVNSYDNIDDFKSNLIAQNDSIKELVQRLLNENSLDIPLSWRPGNRKKNIKTDFKQNENLTQGSCTSKAIFEFDELGFQKKITQENDFDDMFKNITFSCNFYEENLLTLNEDKDFDDDIKKWRSEWNTFVSSLNNNETLNRNVELKNLLRSGIPQEYRPKIWKLCINMLIQDIKYLHEPDYYTNLVKENQQKNWNPSVKQIELDLLRTLPNNRNFESKQCDGISRLRRVLTAYSQRNKVVGYCQGMNRLAAVALLFLNEEDAFWCLVAIVERIMPKDYYTQTLLGAHVDQFVLKDLIQEKLPNIHEHFEKHKIEISLFSWFLTCFVDNVPVNIFLRIWDAFLYEGSKVLFRFALAFLKYHQHNLLLLNDSVLINQYLRIFGEKTYDIKQLTNIAFNVLNPLSMNKLKSKRKIYRSYVTLEFEKLKNIYKTNSDFAETLDSQSD